MSARPAFSLVWGLLGVCLGLTVLISLPVGFAAWLMAERDLKRMSAGVMDPEGRGLTTFGLLLGVLGMGSSLCCVAGYALLPLFHH